jgi:spore coat polysaccharide biosynthesis protein SpsF
MNIGFLITARLKSRRLPLKIIRLIKGKPILSHMISRVKKAKTINKIIVCTSTYKQDDRIKKICDYEKIDCYRGHPDDVLLRLYEASKKFDLDYIVNITADCPLVEPYYIDQICKIYKKKKFDLIRAFDLPHGSWSYGIKIQALKKIIDIKLSSKTEVWGKYFTDINLFKIYDLKIKNKMHIRSKLRMTLDYPEDLKFLRKIYNELYDNNKNFDLTDIILLLNRKPSLININESCGHKYNQKSMKQSKFKTREIIKIKKNLRKNKKFS